MGNPYRGDVTLVLNGEALPMRLTLGALAELEAELDSDSLLGLIERFEGGDFRALDIAALLAAGLRGAGWQGSAKDLLAAEIEGGPVKAASLAALLLKTAFSLSA
jgi:tail tube GTA-gp10-like protein